VDVWAGFCKTLGQAEAEWVERPVRTSLAQSEIKRIADFHFASVLADDDEVTRKGGNASVVRSIASQLNEAGIDYAMAVPLDAQTPPYGLSNREVTKRNEDLASWPHHAPHGAISAWSVRQWLARSTSFA
jgi:hypothetical protein